VDGHDRHALDRSLTELLQSDCSCPKALIARTVKGRGVSFMEGDNRWHYTRLDELTYSAAIEEVSRSQ
jgi:transketolase